MKQIRFFDCTFDELPLDMQEVYILMGYGSHVPNNDILQLIQEIVDELKQRITPHYGYVLVDGEVPEKGKLRLDNQLFNPGVIIAHAMKGAENMPYSQPLLVRSSIATPIS